jgi:nitrous-oxide reductase
MHKKSWLIVGLIVVIATIAVTITIAQRAENRVSSEAANKVYVAPGSYDEFYGFFSGGFNGQVSVVGLPSGRVLRNIPVFSQWAENGYGYSEETRPLLTTSMGFVPWDDAHHPALSQTNGEHDGRWLFINGTNTPRIARIDLSHFETVETIEIPNAGGGHSSPFITMNSEYAVSGTRFSVPIPQRDISIADYKGNFQGTLSFVSVNQETGEMALAFQVLMPGFNYDLARCGKGPSADWCFFTSYNTEEANSLLEVNASQNDKDFVAAVNWKTAEQCIADGKSETMPATYAHNRKNEATGIAETTMHDSVTILKPEGCEGLVYFLPTPKSPHGVDVDPTGEYIVTGGKLSATMAVHSFSNMMKAIEAADFNGDSYGVPILKYESILGGEIEKACLGPLHTEFDGNGFAYTSCFLSSEIIKSSLETFEVVDRVPAFYSIGHLLIPGGDTMKPYGKYVISLNKITKDRYLPTGPELTQSAQLYSIDGEKMEMLLDFPTMGEPHYAQAIAADKLMEKVAQIYPLEDNQHPYAAKTEADTRVERDGNNVHVYMTTIRSHFAPDNIEGVKLGDTVYFHVTNLEQDWDVPHGFATMGMGEANILIMPGQTLTVKWTPTQVGVFPFYCTDFCSALHQEMQGYIRVSPADATTEVKWSTGNTN